MRTPLEGVNTAPHPRCFHGAGGHQKTHHTEYLNHRELRLPRPLEKVNQQVGSSWTSDICKRASPRGVEGTGNENSVARKSLRA